jgi:hypothetical protein
MRPAPCLPPTPNPTSCCRSLWTEPRQCALTGISGVVTRSSAVTRPAAAMPGSTAFTTKGWSAHCGACPCATSCCTVAQPNCPPPAPKEARGTHPQSTPSAWLMPCTPPATTKKGARIPAVVACPHIAAKPRLATQPAHTTRAQSVRARERSTHTQGGAPAPAAGDQASAEKIAVPAWRSSLIANIPAHMTVTAGGRLRRMERIHCPLPSLAHPAMSDACTHTLSCLGPGWVPQAPQAGVMGTKSGRSARCR